MIYCTSRQLCFLQKPVAKNSREWLELRGVAEFAQQFSEAEFTLAELTQQLLPSKWDQQARLFDRVAESASSSAFSSQHVGRKSAQQLEQLQQKLAASVKARRALRNASASVGQPATKKKQAKQPCPSCGQSLSGHSKTRCAAIQSQVSKVAVQRVQLSARSRVSRLQGMSLGEAADEFEDNFDDDIAVIRHDRPPACCRF